MRTGTGIPIPSQDPPPSSSDFIAALKSLGADFYVHHVVPTENEYGALLGDLAEADLEVVLGNEYGNINGPYTEGTNRYDIPSAVLHAAAASGRLAGVLYDEPEHLQMHADQYRKDEHLPHFGQTEGQSPESSIETIERAVDEMVGDIRGALHVLGESSAAAVPVLAEQVFPVMFHTLARAGMTPCPKVMKESFQPLQLATALGASLQYDREFWICADLWGPDIGPWFTRAPGFPGHSPLEFASALRMAYFFGPDRLFVENIDVLVQHRGGGDFRSTEHGEVWREFVEDFVPAHPLRWSHRDAQADIALVHADDSDFGRGQRPFGNRSAIAPETSRSVFDAWHVLSHGRIPADGSCLHIPGFDFPRHRLNGLPRSEFPLAAGAPDSTDMHGLFQPMANVLAFDEHVGAAQLAGAGLILVVGSRLPQSTRALLRSQATEGATVAIASWLAGPDWAASERVGSGRWIVFDSLHDAEVREAIQTHSGPDDRWTQRFGAFELRIHPTSPDGSTLDFEVADMSRTALRR